MKKFGSYFCKIRNTAAALVILTSYFSGISLLQAKPVLAYSGAVILSTGIPVPVNFYTTGHSIGTCNGSTWPSNANFTVPGGVKTCGGDSFGPLSLYLASTPSGYIFNGFTVEYKSPGASTSSCGSNCQNISFSGANSLKLKANFTKVSSTPAPAPVIPPAVPPTPAPTPATLPPAPTASSTIDSHITIGVSGYSGALNLYTTGHSIGDCNGATWPNSSDFQVTGSKMCNGAQFGTPIQGNATNGMYLALRSIPSGYKLNSISYGGSTSPSNGFSCSGSGYCYFNFDSGSVSLTFNFSQLVTGTPITQVPTTPPTTITNPNTTGGIVIVDTQVNSNNTTTNNTTNNGTATVAAKTTTTASTNSDVTGKGIGKLTDTGPGEVISLFTATSTGAGAAHHVFATVRRRKLGF